MNTWAFFQDSIFPGLNKSERGSNVAFFLPCYLIELYKTAHFKWFILNISIQITTYVKPKILQQTLKMIVFCSDFPKTYVSKLIFD